MAVPNQFEMSLGDLTALFKIKYEKLSENVYNSSNVLLGRCKKSYNFVGEKMQITVPQSFAGGVGSGSLPKANKAKYGKAEITSKKLYARVEIDRETIKASLKDEGSFVRATKEVVKKAVESYMRNLSRILFSDGSGRLGISAGTAVKDASLNTTTITITDASFKEADLEERDLVNVEISGSILGGATPTAIEILEVDPANKKIVISGQYDVVADDEIFMQGSKDNDPVGFKGSLISHDDSTSLALLPAEASGIAASVTHLYTLSRDRRWSAARVDAGSASISTDLLNKLMLKVEKQCGKVPNLLVCSYTQYEKILNILEDQKRYTINTRAGVKSKSGADISFNGVEFMSTSGPVGIFPERFADEDKVYALNDSHIHIYHRPDFGWFDDDGTVFMRLQDEDAYEARYGGYLQIYVNPCFHGVLDSLAT